MTDKKNEIPKALAEELDKLLSIPSVSTIDPIEQDEGEWLCDDPYEGFEISEDEQGDEELFDMFGRYRYDDE